MACYTVEDIRDIVFSIARAHGVESVSLFGSYSKGTATYGSDVDLKIEKGRLRSLFDLCDIPSVWDTLNRDIPALKAACELLLAGA